MICANKLNERKANLLHKVEESFEQLRMCFSFYLFFHHNILFSKERQTQTQIEQQIEGCNEAIKSATLLFKTNPASSSAILKVWSELKSYYYSDI